MRGWRSEGLHGEEELERWVWAAASFLLTVLGSNPSLDDRPWTQVGRGDRAAHLAGGSEGGFPALTSAGVGDPARHRKKIRENHPVNASVTFASF